MKKLISLLLCLCLCLPLLAVCASAETSAETSDAISEDGTALSPVEQVFQVISLLILFGGLALFPVYYLLNKRRRRIIASFEQPIEPEDKPADEPNE